MAKKKIEDVDLLLSKLDKIQLADFIRKECVNDRHLQDRFLALGAGSLFKPNPAIYASRVEDLINDYGGRHGYIEYTCNRTIEIERVTILNIAMSSTIIINQIFNTRCIDGGIGLK